MPRIYLSLGTNQGERQAQIQQAIERLESALGVAPTAISSIIETPAWGFEGPAFLNCAVRFDWPAAPGRTPTRLLDLTQRIERIMVRRGGPEWDAAGRRIYHDRPIDIDILFWDTKRVRTTRLLIPHPLIAERDFVLNPLSEILDPETKGAFPEIFERK